MSKLYQSAGAESQPAYYNLLAEIDGANDELTEEGFARLIDQVSELQDERTRKICQTLRLDDYEVMERVAIGVSERGEPEFLCRMLALQDAARRGQDGDELARALVSRRFRDLCVEYYDRFLDRGEQE